MNLISILGDNLLAKRKGEKHKRIKCSTLVKLMTETSHEESIYNLNENSSMHGGDQASQNTGNENIMGLLQGGSNQVPNNDTKSQISNVSNVSGLSAVTYATEALGITDQTSFLLLDLREPEEYDFWRIKESINYPAANIARDKIIPELFRFKNKSNKLIIVYMNDERKGCAAANMMTEKGYDNVFLLSGGIE